MTRAPILQLPKNSIPLTDASSFILEEVLSQKNHPTAFYSKLLCPRGRIRSIYEKELMAIVLAVKKWRHYLLDRNFVIIQTNKV